MPDGKLQYEIEVTGTAAASAGLGEVETGLDKVAAAEKRVSERSSDLSGDVSYASANISKGASEATSAFGRLASFLGGQWGVAILVGLNAAVKFWRKIKTDAEESERKIKMVAAAIREMAGEWTNWLASQQKEMGLDPVSRAKGTVGSLTKEEAQAQVPLMEAEYSRYMKIAENNSRINQANYKKFLEGGGDKNEWQDDPRFQKAKDRVEYYGNVINALKSRISQADAELAGRPDKPISGTTNTTTNGVAEQGDWGRLHERQAELQNMEFLSTVKNDLERMELERNRLVAERDAITDYDYSSQERRLDYSEKILQIESQIRAERAYESAAREDLAARQEEYRLSKKTTAEQLKAVDDKMAALRKGPKNTETEGQMLGLQIRRDALADRLARESQNQNPDVDVDADSDAERRVVDGADYSMKEFNPRKRRFRGMGRHGFMGKGLGHASEWFANQTASRFAAAGHVGVPSEMGRPQMDVKGIDQTNRLLAEIRERL